MSDDADVDTGLVVAEGKQVNRKESELEESGFLACQTTVMMTEDKITTMLTPSKGENKELNLSELGSSPTGSFQSLQSSQSSEVGSGTSIIPLVGGTRVLKLEDTLSEDDCRNFKLIYESILLEGRVGNLTNLILEMVLAEKPPTWLPVIYKRLKYLLINSETFREKKKTFYHPWVGGKEKKSSREVGKQPKGSTTLKDERQHCGKGNKHMRTPGSNLRSYSAIGNQIELLCLLNLDACVGFSFVFYFCLTIWIGCSLVILV